MSDLSQAQAAHRQRTLLTALLLSAPGPLVLGFATLAGNSTTQLADFIRRTIELGALFLSWWVFRRLQQAPSLSKADQSRLEHTAGLGVAGTMLASGFAMGIIALSRLSAFEPGGNVTSGLIIASLGLLVNGWFWRRYAAMTREHYSAVIAAQQSLYRGKTCVDLCVVIALAAVAAAPAHPTTRVVDILGSLTVAGYLLWSGLRLAQSHLGGVREPAC
jgi:divalent metal cation (Fe/Co/Zn/Cd) transporter